MQQQGNTDLDMQQVEERKMSMQQGVEKTMRM
jgi:hypothetical protein